MEEKRKFSRVPFAIGTFFTYRGCSYQGEVHDLSLKGMFVKTPLHADIGAALPFTIQLSGATSDLSLQIEGVVARQTDAGLGIRFEQIDLESFIHLKNIISYNSPDADQIENEFLDFVKENIRATRARNQNS